MTAFLASFVEEREWAQVLIRRNSAGFELRHVADSERPSKELRHLSLADLRQITIYNSAGQFRPLKSAPDLQRGWHFQCAGEPDLWRALQELYPGAVGDWFAASSGQPLVTHYREFTNRQTGMYRITQSHSDEQAAHVISACCAPHLCLKRRFWTVAELAPDVAEQKSSIPCLEPCAVLLELARKSARIEQEERIAMEIPSSDLESFLASAEQLIGEVTSGDRADPPPHGGGYGRSDCRVGDIGSPLNPRRLQLLLDKYRSRVKPRSNTED